MFKRHRNGLRPRFGFEAQLARIAIDFNMRRSTNLTGEVEFRHSRFGRCSNDDEVGLRPGFDGTADKAPNHDGAKEERQDHVALRTKTLHVAIIARFGEFDKASGTRVPFRVTLRSRVSAPD